MTAKAFKKSTASKVDKNGKDSANFIIRQNFIVDEQLPEGDDLVDMGIERYHLLAQMIWLLVIRPAACRHTITSTLVTYVFALDF